jgi:hypothetical protein
MSNPQNYVEDGNLSLAWGKAIREVSARGRTEVVPLVVSITGFDGNNDFSEDQTIRSELDKTLEVLGLQSIATVATTIFPYSMWNQSADRKQLFDRYKKLFPRIQKASPKNRRGIYFNRMITGGPPANDNQLDFAISTYSARQGMRRSALQVVTFDPVKDHTAAPYLAFPCLQHVTFAPTEDNGLAVNAFYANQYMVERAYGNYVGLCHLGKFVASELDLKLSRVTCFAGIASLDRGKREIASTMAAVERALGSS